MQLTHNSTPSKRPLLTHNLLTNPLTHQSAKRIILQQSTRIILANTLQLLHAQLIPAIHHGVKVLHCAGVEFRVGVWKREFRGRRLNPGLAGGELFEGDVEGGRERVVARRGCVERDAAVGQGVAGRGEREEVLDEREVVRVDRLELRAHVRRVGHPVREAVDGDEHRRTRLEGFDALNVRVCGGRGEFFPERLEDGPGVFGAAGAEEREGVQRRGLGDGFVERPVVLRDVQSGEDGAVGVRDGSEERCGCVVLSVFNGVGVGEGSVGGRTADIRTS